MPRYRVEITYDIGMSGGGETHEFEAKNDKDAKAYIKKHDGDSLSPIKKDVHFDTSTLSKIIE